MKSLYREPLVHFLVLGGLIFAAFAFVDDSPARASRERLEVIEVDAARLTRQFEAVAQRPPGKAELSSLIDRYIREEALAREARALSFDRDDEVVRQRLVQKMQFMLESGVDAAAPTEADVRAHFEKNAERFAAAPLVAFRQFLLDADAATAQTVLAALRSGSDPSAYARASPLPADIPPVSKRVVDGTFGEGFFDQLAKLEIGQWSGPIKSTYGMHLVRVSVIEPARAQPFEAVREAVEKDWRWARARQRYDAILSRYEIRRSDAGGAPAK